MLPKSELESDYQFILPPRIKSDYKNFELLAETSSYKVFEAQTCDSNEKHTIRILDRTKEFVNKESDLTATLFVKELLHLQYRYPGSVLTNTFEITENGQQIACATLPYTPLNYQVDESKEVLNPKDPEIIQKLLSDTLTDIEFLWKNMQIKKVMEVLGLESLCFMKEKGAFFLSDWAKVFQIGLGDHPIRIAASKTSLQEERLNSQKLSGEIKALALATLKLNKIDLKEIENLQGTKDANPKMYDSVIKSMVKEYFADFQALQTLIERMLSLDFQSLPNLEEFRIKEAGSQVPAKPVNEEKTHKKSKAKKDSLSKKTTTRISEITPTSGTLLAWSSRVSNEISVIDVETKQEHLTFDGPVIDDTYWSSTLVKEIPNTKLLVSLHHNFENSANMAIFDISRSRQARQVYSFEEVFGVTCNGDVAYNARRNLLAAIPLEAKIAYHLFNVDAYAANAKDIVKLLRRSKWHSKYSKKYATRITSFDFNPAGESIASIDCYGVCLISDVNTNKRSFHLNLGGEDNYARCRWSTKFGRSLVFVKYAQKKLNILDVEKKAFTLKNAIEVEKDNYTSWIDVCQSNANLVAAAGCDKRIRIFDKRESKIVKSFKDMHTETINCVRWNPSGDMLASASGDNSGSGDKRVVLLDFKAGKAVYTNKSEFGSITC